MFTAIHCGRLCSSRSVEDYAHDKNRKIIILSLLFYQTNIMDPLLTLARSHLRDSSEQKNTRANEPWDLTQKSLSAFRTYVKVPPATKKPLILQHQSKTHSYKLLPAEKNRKASSRRESFIQYLSLRNECSFNTLFLSAVASLSLSTYHAKVYTFLFLSLSLLWWER